MTKKDWRIVLTASRGLQPFVVNALHGLESCDIDMSSVLLVTPQDHVEEFRAISSAFSCELRGYDADLVGEMPIDEAAYAPYGTSVFSDIMSLRVPMILRLLQEHEFILFADVDIAWLNSPLDYLEHVLSTYPIAMQTEAVGQFPPPFCMGFIAARAGEATTRILNWFQEQYVVDRRVDKQAPMQVTFNRLLRENVSETKNIFTLPEALFPNGRLYRAVREPSRFEMPLVPLPEPYIFHANWTIGLEAKVALLSACRLWAGDAADPMGSAAGDAGVAKKQYENELQKLRGELDASRQDLASISKQLILTDAALTTRTEHAECLARELADRIGDVAELRELLSEFVEAAPL
ncbi:MAG: putative nucleotide-diphospho-sugar transferase [Caulobacteraceae bacterium]